MEWLFCDNIFIPQTLKPACVDALKRIFQLCDTDKDGSLNDEELNEFQVSIRYLYWSLLLPSYVMVLITHCSCSENALMRLYKLKNLKVLKTLYGSMNQRV